MSTVGERPTCDRCERPIHDTAYVCSVCADRLRDDLGSVAAVAGEAWTTIARLARLGTDSPGRSAERPLPFSWEAADATWAASNTLTTWARHIAETRGITLTGPAGPTQGPLCRVQSCHHTTCARIISRANEHPLAYVARFLAEQLTWLRHRQEADDAFDELIDACRLAVRTIDQPPVRWYAGKCDNCDTDLYAAPSAKFVRCRDCSTEHDADERRAWLLDLAEDQLVHASLAAAAITALGHPVKDSTVRKWAERGRLAPHGTDHRGRPIYRVGDVRVLAIESERRAETRNLTAA